MSVANMTSVVQSRLLQIAIDGVAIDNSCQQFIHIHPGHIRAIERVNGSTIIVYPNGQRSFSTSFDHHMAIVEQWRELLR